MRRGGGGERQGSKGRHEEEERDLLQHERYLCEISPLFESASNVESCVCVDTFPRLVLIYSLLICPYYFYFILFISGLFFYAADFFLWSVGQ